MSGALIEALLNGLWSGVVLTAVVAALLRLTERWTTPAERYAIWFATLVTIVFAPLVEILGTAFAAARPVAAPIVTDLVSPPASFEAPALASPTLEISAWFGRGVTLAWLAGALALAGLLALRLRAALCLKRFSQDLPAELRGRVAAWAREAPSGRSAETRWSAEARTPLTVGWLRPAVLLSPSPRGEEDLHPLWLHEQAHVRRYDDWTQLFGAVAAAVFWYHPAVHWILARLDAEREAACDDAVVDAGVAPERYAGALTRLAEAASMPPAAALGVAGRRTHLFRRVEMLMSNSKLRRRPAVRQAFAGGAVAAGLFIVWACGSGPRVVLAQAPPPTPAPAATPAPAPEPRPAPKPAPVQAPAPAPRPAPKPPPAPAPDPPDTMELHERMERLQLEMRPHIERLESMAQQVQRIVEENIEPHREEIERLSAEIHRQVESELEPLHQELAARAEELAKRHAELAGQHADELEQRMHELQQRLHEKQGPIREMHRKLREIQHEHIREAQTQIREIERRMRQEQREMREVERRMRSLESEERERPGAESAPQGI